MAQKKNAVNQRQFRGGYVPDQPIDPDDRAYRKEPNSPTQSRKRDGVQLGAQTQARPGLVGMSDYSRKKRKK